MNPKTRNIQALTERNELWRATDFALEDIIGWDVPIFGHVQADPSLAGYGKVARRAGRIQVDFDIDQMSIDAVNGRAVCFIQRHEGVNRL